MKMTRDIKICISAGIKYKKLTLEINSSENKSNKTELLEEFVDAWKQYISNFTWLTDDEKNYVKTQIKKKL